MISRGTYDISHYDSQSSHPSMIFDVKLDICILKRLNIHESSALYNYIKIKPVPQFTSNSFTLSISISLLHISQRWLNKDEEHVMICHMLAGMKKQSVFDRCGILKQYQHRLPGARGDDNS